MRGASRWWIRAVVVALTGAAALSACGEPWGDAQAPADSAEGSRPWFWLNASAGPRVEGPIALDPVLEFPAEPVWREFWLPIQNDVRGRSPTTQMTREMVGAGPGMVVADIGAGGGYWAFQWARAVGDTGRVLAIDIDARMTRKLSFERGARGVTNMDVLQVPVGDLGLRPGSVDVVTFLGIGAFDGCSPARNAGYFRQAWEALRPGGRLVITDRPSLDPGPQAPACARGLGADDLVALAGTTFRLVRREDHVKSDGVDVFGLQFERLP